jgi:prolyl oligopeptidase
MRPHPIPGESETLPMKPPFLALLLGSLLAAPLARAADTPIPPPETRVEVVRDTLHGDVIEDPYRWLEDKDSPETRAWVREQMAYTRHELEPVPGRAMVQATVAKFSKLDARSTPQVAAGRLFFTSRAATQQQARLMMRSGAEAPNVVLVDPDTMSSDHTVSVNVVDVSMDASLLAYAVRTGGADEIVVRFLSTLSKRDTLDALPLARYLGIAIDPKKEGCWYSRWEPKGPRVWYHRFGDPVEKDQKVFGDGLVAMEIPSLQMSENGRWLMVTVFKGSSSTDTRIWVRSTREDGTWTSVTDTLHALVSASFAGDRIVIRTDWNAPNRRLFVVDAAAPALSHWYEIVKERPDATLDSYSLACGRIFAKYLHNVTAELAVYGIDGKPKDPIALPGLGNASPPSGEWAGTDAYYTYSSFNAPPTIYRWNATSGKSVAWWKSAAPLASDRYEVRQEWFTSKDGTKVPMFVTGPKGMVYDGSHPVLMTGYGGFNVSELPNFSARIASWLDMGGVFVLVTLRGGGEFGESWHEAGMLGNKQNVFDDFIAAGEWLVANKVTTRAKLGIYGGSNGGLLMGAMITQRPDLWGAVECSVPLLDMLRYHRFLVARFWIPEYGSSDDATQYAWLKAYSPYQHLVPGTAYPPILFVSGDSDTRVDPLHARKMAARMQALHGPNPVLLWYDVNSGHSGGKSVDAGIEDLTDELQWFRWQLGMAK